MRIVAFGLFIIGLIGAAALWALFSFNHFSAVTRDFAGRCAPVSGVAGPEDMAVDRASGRVFISSLDRRAEDARGAIHIFDPADPLAAAGWRDISGGAPEAFEPLGLDYFEADGVRRLFVVNAVNNAIEIFDVAEDGALTHLDTKAERRLTSPNSVAAVGINKFYVTNDIKAGRQSALGTAQFLLRAPEGDVYYFDGVAWSVSASGLRFANGVAVSYDGARLFVAETTGKSVRIFNRDGASGALTEYDRVATPFAPDNLSIDADGALWVAGLPKPLTLPRHGANPAALAPSAVLRIDETGATPVYRDEGSELSASTVATRIGDALLIGALYEQKFLLCDLPESAF